MKSSRTDWYYAGIWFAMLVALLFATNGNAREFSPELREESAQVERPMMDYDAVLETWLASALGIPYVYGGDNPIEGYDCSGFVMEYLRMFGIGPSVDSASHEIYSWFMARTEKVEHYAPSKGALIFYGKKSADGRKIERISHIGLMISPYQVAEAGGGDQSTLSAREAAARNAFVRIRPYKYRKDMVFIILPKMPSWAGFEPDYRAKITENCTGSACSEPTYANYRLPYYY